MVNKKLICYKINGFLLILIEKCYFILKIKCKTIIVLIQTQSHQYIELFSKHNKNALAVYYSQIAVSHLITE